MSKDESPRREPAKTYHDCARELRILVESVEEYCGDLGHAQLFVREMEGALVYIVVPDNPEAGRDASTRPSEILGHDRKLDGIENGTQQH